MPNLFKICLVLLIIFVPHFSVASTSDSLQQIASQDSASREASVFAFMTALSFIPVMVIAMTAFTRIIVVFSMLRFAFGMQQTPPNIVLIVLSLFFTLFVMQPTLQEVEESAFEPYQQGQLTLYQATNEAANSFKSFMISQTREKDMKLMFDISMKPPPKLVSEISMTQLIPAFMLSELRTAFQIGFVLFLPFLMIDLIVAGTLMSLGMIMVPPMTIAMPLKILVFVLVDGWSLVSRSLLGSFSIF
jgi:flagellar biosynthesis protein FliP